MDIATLKDVQEHSLAQGIGSLSWPDLAVDHRNSAAHALRRADVALLVVISLSIITGFHVIGEGNIVTAAALVVVSLSLLIPLSSFDLYAGFGLMRHERLRRRWLSALLWFGLATPFFAMLSLVYVLFPLLSMLSFMALSPIVEDITRTRLIKCKRWGIPVKLAGSEKQQAALLRILGQNKHLGLIPLKDGKGATAVAMLSGGVLPEEASIYPKLFVVEEGGLVHGTFARRSLLSRMFGEAKTLNPRRLPWRAIKRTMDLGVGGLALVLALPIMVISAVFIYMADRGSVFFHQPRRGLHGQTVQVWKLRSMYKDSATRLEKLLAEDLDIAAEWQARFKLKNDPRVLPVVGKIVRKFSIDELPQLFGVMTGELSLVGPRVFTDYDLAFYSPEALRARQDVVPGLTGLWQVSVRSQGDNQDKVRYDLAYIKGWSLWLDLDILYRTLGVVLTGRGAA